MYPGFLARLGDFRARDLEGPAAFAIAGDFLYGPSVEGAVLSGFHAADRLIRRMNVNS
jgi:predicted NAD/FAD-dependent oxidoreductase